MTEYLGKVTEGSLSRGLMVRLEAPIEEVRAGRLVAIQGENRRFLGYISDVSLASLSPQLASAPPPSDPFLAQVLAGTGYYGQARVLPKLILGEPSALLEGPQPATAIPPHFSPVHEASQQDVELVYGREDKRRFVVGSPLDMEVKVCLDAPLFVQRSNGVFGKTGSGKTFFTRLLLINLIQKGEAVNLVFDMHGEYGWGRPTESGVEAKGLKQTAVASRVAVFALDREAAQRRRVSPDHIVEIGYEQIEPEDMGLLRQALNLTAIAAEATYTLTKRYRQGWLAKALSLTDEELKELNIPDMTYDNLRRGLDRLRRLPFLVEHPPEDSVGRILKALQEGTSVVLDFGRHSDLTTYVLVANVLTRRLHEIYQKLTDQAQAEGAPGPTPLVITIEEAHRFLAPEVAGQTIFGTIAREMRKYNVTLLVIDQRPSGIDPEVLSQLGTRVLFPLDDERDIEAALAGSQDRAELKNVLSRLPTQRHALILGHALPMPLAIQVEDVTSSQFLSKYGVPRAGEGRPRSKIGDLFPDE
ncbi:MAG: ATP-binding protein [Chloroflexi bacterium]|nr:ATP-binding protein [Chloroflexota bacterium]